MIKVQVETTVVDLKTGTSAKTGKPYAIREQEAWGFFIGRDGKPNLHPQRIKVTLDDGANPYEIGMYQLCPNSLYADKWGQVSVRARLVPLIQSASKAA